MMPLKEGTGTKGTHLGPGNRGTCPPNASGTVLR